MTMEETKVIVGVKTTMAAVAAGALAWSIGGSAAARPVGPDAQACAAGKPALVVRVFGFKQATGRLRLKLYDADPRTYLGKTSQLDRIVVPVRSGGQLDVCVPVPHAGGYVVSVLHDVDGDNDAESSDGGGVTGNPRVSLGDAITGRRPPLARVTVWVGTTPVIAPVRLMYKQGLSIGPVRNPV